MSSQGKLKKLACVLWRAKVLKPLSQRHTYFKLLPTPFDTYRNHFSLKLASFTQCFQKKRSNARRFTPRVCRSGRQSNNYSISTIDCSSSSTTQLQLGRSYMIRDQQSCQFDLVKPAITKQNPRIANVVVLPWYHSVELQGLNVAAVQSISACHWHWH